MIFLSRVDVGFGVALAVGVEVTGFFPVVCGVGLVVAVCSGVDTSTGSGVGATVKTSAEFVFVFELLLVSAFELSPFEVAAKSMVGSGVSSTLGDGDASGTTVPA